MSKKVLIAIIWISCLYFLFTVSNNVLADFSYARGISLGSISDLQIAVKMNPHEPAYLRNLSLGLSGLYKQETDSKLRETIKEQTVVTFQVAYNLNPQNLLTLKSMKLGLENLGEEKSAYEISLEMVRLSPTDPTLWYEKAKTERMLGLLEESKESYEKTLELRSDATAFPPP